MRRPSSPTLPTLSARPSKASARASVRVFLCYGSMLRFSVRRVCVPLVILFTPIYYRYCTVYCMYSVPQYRTSRTLCLCDARVDSSPDSFSSLRSDTTYTCSPPLLPLDSLWLLAQLCSGRFASPLFSSRMRQSLMSHIAQTEMEGTRRQRQQRVSSRRSFLMLSSTQRS